MLLCLVTILAGLAPDFAAGLSEQPSWVLDYETKGFVTPLDSLPEGSIAHLRNLVADMEAEGLNLKDQTSHSVNPHFVRPGFMLAAADPAVLNALEAVLGPDIVLLSTTLFTKYPLNATAASMGECLSIIGAHQDRQYWGILPASNPVLSVWVAIDDATEENGAMIFYSGTHKSALKHDKFTDKCSALQDGQSIPKMFLGENWTRAELKSGEYALFDGMVAHSSPANRSPRRRIGFTMIYTAVSSYLGPMSYTKDYDASQGGDFRKPVLVRGSGEEAKATLFDVVGFNVRPASRQLPITTQSEEKGADGDMA